MEAMASVKRIPLDKLASSGRRIEHCELAMRVRYRPPSTFVEAAHVTGGRRQAVAARGLGVLRARGGQHRPAQRRGGTPEAGCEIYRLVTPPQLVRTRWLAERTGHRCRARADPG